MLYINPNLAYVHEQSDHIRDRERAFYNFHFHGVVPRPGATPSTTRIESELLSAMSGPRAFYASSVISQPDAATQAAAPRLDELLRRGSFSGGRRYCPRFIGGNTAPRNIVDEYAPGLHGFVIANTDLQEARGNMCLERAMPGNLPAFVSTLNLSEAELVLGLPEDYTAACPEAGRFELLSQCVPVDVQAFVFAQLVLRVKPSRPSPAMNDANIARLQAYIKAMETNIARAKEDLDVAVANRQAHLFGSP